MPRVKRKAGSGTATRRPRRFGTESTGIASAARPMQEAPRAGGGYDAATIPTATTLAWAGATSPVYQPKDGVEVFTGIVAVSAAIMQTPWQQPPLNMPVSYFMLRDPNDDPMRGEKELMDPGWFIGT